ncbi:pre-mRNA-splicing factor CWC25 homolog [Salvia hispanica]|uniref:pre-mRNA-splicing factor CWC25 homolog n=1 Tax=Salvia hispanica TaxID=49212 RepID=UPI002009B875|nr:pre-mRNA-splicing factor CWC25 homolog [Salvia hispanica]
MALKFLNKKGWHTGSLRNIENVWKAEQKHEAEQRKLEELRKQIHEERDRAEFRQLQEQAGLISGQERLEFLYDSGLAVGKGSGFKALESLPKAEPGPAASSSTSAKEPQPASLGALFEDKPQSANDSWRKLTFDPLLSIRRSEQESLARIKKNPIQMDMIRKSVEAQKNKDKDGKKHKKKHHKKKPKHNTNLSSDNDSEDDLLTVEKHKESRHKGSRSEKHSSKRIHTSDDELSEGDGRIKKYYDESKDRRPSGSQDASLTVEKHRESRHKGSRSEKHSSKRVHISDDELSERDSKRKKYHDEYKDRRPNDEYKDRRPNDEHKDRRPNDEHNDRRPKDEHRDRRPNDEHRDRRPKDEHRDRRPNDQHRDRRPNDEHKDRRPIGSPNRNIDRVDDDQHRSSRSHHESNKERSSEQQHEPCHEKNSYSYSSTSVKPPRPESNNRPRKAGKLSEEERAAKLKEMEMDAQRHEEQRWTRIKKAEDAEAKEAILDHVTSGRNFLDATQKSVYGAEKGGSSTIEESVRRRAYYSQRRSDSESNAFRRA